MRFGCKGSKLIEFTSKRKIFGEKKNERKTRREKEENNRERE